METESSHLPKFESPPVVETILGVFFRPLRQMTSAHQGILWNQYFRDRFPKLEERPPIEEVRERFGEERLAPTELQWRISGRPDTPRLWLASQGGEHVLQVQPSAMLANWLRKSGKGSYRSFAERSRDFFEDLAKLAEFLAKHELGSLAPTSCVATYINHITIDDFADLSPGLAATIASWQDRASDEWLPNPDNVALEIGYPMPDQAGRLNVKATPAVLQPEQEIVIRLELTARVAVDDASMKSAEAKIELAHEWVVRGFASVTTKEKHQIWGRRQ